MGDRQELKRFNMVIGLTDVTSREASGNDWVSWRDCESLLADINSLENENAALKAEIERLGQIIRRGEV